MNEKITVAIADLTSELAVMLAKEQPSVIAWRNHEKTPAPHVKIVDALWLGNALTVTLANGQTFTGMFGEVTGNTYQDGYNGAIRKLAEG